jgi:hypothetical protein
LELDGEKLVAVFRRDWKMEKEKEFIPRGFLKRIGVQFWNPQTAKILGIFFVSAVFFLYLGIQLTNYFSTPRLEIYEPKSGAVVQNQEVEIRGETNPQNSVYVNDRLIKINSDGSFNYNLKLFPGENKILIKAVNRQNKIQTVERKVKMVDNK